MLLGSPYLLAYASRLDALKNSDHIATSHRDLAYMHISVI